jgi:hypothetical protein
MRDGLRGAGWFGLIGGLMLALPLHVLGQQSEPVPFLRVNGQAQVSVQPDAARISFAVETQARTAQLAGSDNADLMDAVVRALRGAGIEGLVIETHGYSLTPIYTRAEPNRPPRIDEYRVTNHVQVRTTDLDGVGALLDLGIGAGANRIANLSFEASDVGAARLEAVQLAVRNARQEAEAAAIAARVELGPALEIQVNSQVPRGADVAMRTSMTFDAAVVTPIEAGAQIVSANVTIRYGIGG